MAPLRFAIVGCGAIAQAHADAIRAHPAARLLAGVDVLEAVRERVGPRWGVPVFGSVSDMLRQATVDAACVCVPPAWHAEVSSELLASGVHVLCEKPLAPSLATARALFAEARRRRVRLGVSAKFRFVEDVREARRRIADGAIGEPRSCEIAFCAALSLAGHWRVDPARSGGGVVMDNACHAFDILAEVLELPIERLTAGFSRSAAGSGVEDGAAILFTAGATTLGRIVLSWAHAPKDLDFLTVIGDRGALRLSWTGGFVRRHDEREWTHFGTGYEKTAAFNAQLAAFVDWIAGGAAPVAEQQLLRNVALVEEVYRAAEKGRWRSVTPRGRPREGAGHEAYRSVPQGPARARRALEGAPTNGARRRPARLRPARAAPTPGQRPDERVDEGPTRRGVMRGIKRVLVTGGGGFIGHHLVRSLKDAGCWVRASDVKHPEYEASDADEFVIADLRRWEDCLAVTSGVEEVYALAADMGGMGFISRDQAAILRNNVLISTHGLEAARVHGVRRYLYASSACVYPEYRQLEAALAPLREEEAYPAQPQDAYGWEKLITERLCTHYREDFALETRIVRFHNIFGPLGTWRGGREKAPAALARKVAVAKLTGSPEIEIWGDGEQTRSFCYVEDCIEGIHRLMASEYVQPINLGQDRLVTINQLADMVMATAGVRLRKRHVAGPEGVRGRNSDNSRLREVLAWQPQVTLEEGIARTYAWIEEQVRLSLVAAMDGRVSEPRALEFAAANGDRSEAVPALQTTAAD